MSQPISSLIVWCMMHDVWRNTYDVHTGKPHWNMKSIKSICYTSSSSSSQNTCWLKNSSRASHLALWWDLNFLFGIIIFIKFNIFMMATIVVVSIIILSTWIELNGLNRAGRVTIMSCGLSALSIPGVSISWGQLILGRTLIGAHGCLAQFMGPYWLWHDIWGHGEYRPIGHHHIKQLEVTSKVPPWFVVDHHHHHRRRHH